MFGRIVRLVDLGLSTLMGAVTCMVGLRAIWCLEIMLPVFVIESTESILASNRSSSVTKVVS